ncbi:MAG: hypothetical protein WBA54_10375 [Acidaminobacteraceae bacterium]
MAEESSKATDEIRKTVNDIISIIENASNAMDKSILVSEKSTAKLEDTRLVFNEISTSVDKEILASAEEESESIDNVSNSTDGLKKLVSNLSESIEIFNL